MTFDRILRFAAFSLFALGLSSAPEPFNVDRMLEVANLRIEDLSDDGRFAAVTSGSLRDRIGIDNHRFGDPTYIAPQREDLWVIDTRSGDRVRVFEDRRQVRALAWSPGARLLAVITANGGRQELVLWDRETRRAPPVAPPPGTAVDGTAELQWAGERLILSLRASDWERRAADAFRALTSAPVVVHSSQDPFLGWINLRRLASERSVWSYDTRGGVWKELAAAAKRPAYRVTEDGAALLLTDDIAARTDYDSLGQPESRIDALAADGGRRTLVKSTKGLTLQWSRDGRTYAYAKDGAVFVGLAEGGEARRILGPAKEDKPAEGEEAKKNDKERFSVVRVSPKGDRLILSNKEGLWIAATGDGARELMVRMPEEDKQGPRYTVLDFSPDGNFVYLQFQSRQKWERGVSRYDVAAKKIDDLFRDGRLYSQWRLAKDGSRWVFLAAAGNRPHDLYTADASLGGVRRLAESNPQLRDTAFGKTELISYLDVDGRKLHGVVYYPPDYDTAKRYPVVFNIYEQFFDDTFNGTINVLTANGYVVVQPSVELETGFPGEAWVKAVTAAANKLIEMRVADPDRLAVQGTSYGGYATNLLITQTSRFKAAINISGKVNMVSFYTDSPRLGVRNIHAPEKSQDRIGATLWQQPQKYLAHSAILYADRIKTPLLLITGEQDHNVPARQAMEMYYALRRLGKEVAWVNYTNGGHGMPTSTEEEVRDYHRRILEWYERHLKKPAEAKPSGG